MWLIDILFRPIIDWLNSKTRTVEAPLDLEAPAPRDTVVKFQDPRDMHVWHPNKAFRKQESAFIGGWAPGQHLRDEPVPQPTVPTFHALPPSVYKATGTNTLHSPVGLRVATPDGVRLR
jgi:hypothetical protein